MNYQEWEPTVPTTVKADRLWKLNAYRLALFLGDLARQDVTRLRRDSRTSGIASQLCAAVGSISAKIEAGGSCDLDADRARLYETALCSACESRHWYQKSCQVLGEAITDERLGLLEDLVCALLCMIPHKHTSAERAELVPVPAHILKGLKQKVPVA